ncbi:MAG: helix-hairpin-helix domain-containing protein [Thaumarchaeota archaeon]|nr:helix-hairpin-helix domain-containing protein [Nitrososphaerota archaeon]MCY3976222.1 helix-hairpin-helix domain-containing protein [Nitrososphaerota archaeon]
MNLNDLRIIVDEREKKSGIPDLLRSVGINLEIKTLIIGDYIVKPETIIERKSLKDFFLSIFDGRLFNQCQKLKDHYQYPIILIEGNLSDMAKISENPFIFYGAISSILIDFRIPVTCTPDIYHTSKLLISMSSKHGVMNGTFLKKIRKPENLKLQQLALLCSLPGIGEKTAEKLLSRFGSPLDVLNASTVSLSKVDGLSSLRVKKIKKILNDHYHIYTKSLTKQGTLN